jgi:hypothetical protein
LADQDSVEKMRPAMIGTLRGLLEHADAILVKDRSDAIEYLPSSGYSSRLLRPYGVEKTAAED